MIHQHGYWTEKSETDLHACDESLCNAIIEIFNKKLTIVDLGCGNGAYTKRFIEAGFDCRGYDGSPLTPEISGGVCGVLDLSEPIDIGVFDMVVSLEVGEHIPAEYEQIFIDNICKSSKKYVLLSWGVEGQPGVGHVNCRNNDYIIKEMERRGLRYNKIDSDYLRSKSTFPWFANTVMLFYHG